MPKLRAWFIGAKNYREMRLRFFRKVRHCFAAANICLAAGILVFGQSTDQKFPSPISTNEITGKIPARDIGDARLTSYFYIFNGSQGDIFINVETVNLNGDIDIFVVEGLRPLTKIAVYAGGEPTETGRVVYLRKNEKLLLRIEGRSPNDDEARFRIKFAGSFEPIQGGLAESENAPPGARPANESGIRVNSVGTIIGETPKVEPAESKAKGTSEEKAAKKDAQEPTQVPGPVSTAQKNAKSKKPPKPKPVVSEAAAKESEEGRRASSERAKKQKAAPVASPEKPAGGSEEAEKHPDEEAASAETENAPKEPEKKTSKAKMPQKSAKPKAEEKQAEPNPLAAIYLRVLFKDGSKIERPMDEVLRVNVDKGILTIVTKDGKIERHSILDVTKMTIE